MSAFLSVYQGVDDSRAQPKFQHARLQPGSIWRKENVLIEPDESRNVSPL